MEGGDQARVGWSFRSPKATMSYQPKRGARPLCRLLIQQQRPVALYLRPVVDVVIIFIVSMHRQFETWVSIIVT